LRVARICFFVEEKPVSRRPASNISMVSGGSEASGNIYLLVYK